MRFRSFSTRCRSGKSAVAISSISTGKISWFLISFPNTSISLVRGPRWTYSECSTDFKLRFLTCYLFETASSNYQSTIQEMFHRHPQLAKCPLKTESQADENTTAVINQQHAQKLSYYGCFNLVASVVLTSTNVSARWVRVDRSSWLHSCHKFFNAYCRTASALCRRSVAQIILATMKISLELKTFVSTNALNSGFKSNSATASLHSKAVSQGQLFSASRTFGG